MARKPKAPPPPPPIITAEDIQRAQTMGLRVLSYQNYAVAGYWVPKDILGSDGKTVALWRGANDGNYAIDGWEPWHDGMNGGRYQSLGSVLWWIERARSIRAGTHTHF